MLVSTPTKECLLSLMNFPCTQAEIKIENNNSDVTSDSIRCFADLLDYNNNSGVFFVERNLHRCISRNFNKMI